MEFVHQLWQDLGPVIEFFVFMIVIIGGFKILGKLGE